MKKLLRQIPPLRWLDDFTDTDTGRYVVLGLVLFAVLLWIVFKTGPAR